MTNRGSSGRNCLFCLLFKVIVALVVIICLATLVFWLIFRPANPELYVVDAALTEFSLENNTTLKYNLALNLTACNPNKRVGVYYEKIKALAYYEDHMFSSVTLKSFYLEHKNTSVLSPVFQGQKSLVDLTPSDLNEFSAEKAIGIFSIDLRVHLSMKLRFGKLTNMSTLQKIEYGLKVPLNGSRFQSTKWSLEK
ncbi:hypothetical protein QQ045_028688 [Rhodiola kirilowii]